MCVASRCFHCEDTALNVEKGHIESTATKIVDEHIPLLVRFTSTETVRDGCRGGLVDDSQNVETSNGTSVFRRLPLIVVEVSWNSDHSFRHFLSEFCLCHLFHLGDVNGMSVHQVCALLTLPRTMAEISCGEKVFFSPRYSTSTFG